ncbi:MAG: DUF924 family protein [Pseudomonadota bacterium]
MSTETIAAINAFWLGESQSSPEAGLARKDWWYRGGAVVDDEIRARFGDFVEQACERKLMGWADTSGGALALILLLDQFTRNIYRHSPAAYGGDACAMDAVQSVIAQELDQELHPVSRIWLYHPFHHSEDVAKQDYGLSLLERLKAASPEEWQPYVQHSITGWTRHRNIVAEYGRFPHRNDVLGRQSTQDELAFLAKGAEAFGQGKK